MSLFLTPRDLQMQTGTVQEIADAMKHAEPAPSTLPLAFARAVGAIVSTSKSHEKETNETCTTPISSR